MPSERRDIVERPTMWTVQDVDAEGPNGNAQNNHDTRREHTVRAYQARIRNGSGSQTFSLAHRMLTAAHLCLDFGDYSRR